MSDKYKIFEGDEVYFVTFTIVEWINVLAEHNYKMIIIDSISYCQSNKGLVVYGYCIMPNHVHMIIQATQQNSLSAILRDLKKFTSKAIVNKLLIENSEESNNILSKFREAGKHLTRIKDYKVWQDGNRAKLIYSNKFLWEKLTYIHNNPVEKGLCDQPWDYLYSSATNYTDKKSLLDVVCLSVPLGNV
ncbi:MAG: transposase [Bacteroidetes bacterium]|nr:transposase [Bacteroidota bacterium]